MVNKRIIPKIILKKRNHRVVASITRGYDRNKAIADPVSLSRIYRSQNANEICILNTTKTEISFSEFLDTVRAIAIETMAPVSAGGNIGNVNQIEQLFKAGADKMILCSAIFNNQKFVREAVAIYGSANIVAALDYRSDKAVFIERATKTANCSLEDAIKLVHELKFGEVHINSIERDGSKKGLDLEIAKLLVKNTMPTIIGSGVGNAVDIIDGLIKNEIDGVSSGTFLATADQNLGQIYSQVRNAGISI